MNCTTSEMLSALLMVWVECVLFQKKKKSRTTPRNNLITAARIKCKTPKF